MTRKENKKGKGTVSATFTSGGQTTAQSDVSPYTVIDKEAIFFGDSEWKADINGNTMTLTTNDDRSSVVVLSFTK